MSENARWRTRLGCSCLVTGRLGFLGLRVGSRQRTNVLLCSEKKFLRGCAGNESAPGLALLRLEAKL